MPDAEDALEPTADAEPPTRLITRLLGECAEGDRDAFDRLIGLVYDDLRAIAHRRLAEERPDHTLNTEALVHEAYLRLADQATATWQHRAHFFALAATVIRRILVDHARSRGAAKRGGDVVKVPLRDDIDGQEPRAVELLALDEALETLGRRDERLRKVVDCRFFGGMTMDDTAEALGVSLRTAERDWTRARAYLYQALGTDAS